MEWNNSFTELLEIQCVTKSAGGLGLKRVEDEAYMESFCFSWLNLSVVIKISLKCSWGWRKLIIGGILMIFFTPATSYGYRVVYDAASSLKEKVSSVLKEKNLSGSHFG